MQTERQNGVELRALRVGCMDILAVVWHDATEATKTRWRPATFW